MISLRSIRLCTLGFAFLGAHVAYAEGGCPPGSYPIGGQGVQGCAPIPGAGGGVSQQSPSPRPRPLGEWIRTWGGVAVPPLRQTRVFQPASFRRRLLSAMPWQSVQIAEHETAR